MISEGAILYYCLGTMIPCFNATENNVTVTLPDPVEIDNIITASSDCTESEYSDSYTLTFECRNIDGAILQTLSNETSTPSHNKHENSHFKWLANYHTSMCKLKSGFRHKNTWHRTRSRCWVSSPCLNAIMALVIVLVLV